MFVVKVYCKIDLGPGSPRMPIPHRVPLNQLGSKASGVKRRTSNGTNLILKSETNRFCSLAMGSSHVKFRSMHELKCIFSLFVQPVQS